MNENMEQWLKSVGYSGNPFAFHEAGREKKLPQYFVSPSCFREICGMPNEPVSSIVFASRGFGKTAQRIMLQHQCRKDLKNRHGRALAISYSDFELLPIPVTPAELNSSVRLHVFEILHHSMNTLTEALLNNGSMIENFQQLSDNDKIYLRWFLYTFKNTLSLNQLEALENKGIFPVDLSSGKDRSVSNKKNKQLIYHHLNIKIKRSSIELLRHFVRKLNQLGYDSLYILVDGVDECSLPSFDYDSFIRLIHPLFAQLAILNIPGAAFKFFLPSEWAPFLFHKKLIREDRIRVHHLEWSNKQMTEILKKRLAAFDGPSELAALCAPELAEIIEKEIINLASGSPRSMIRLGCLLFNEHCSTNKTDISQKIEMDAWLRAKKRFDERSDIECSSPFINNNSKKSISDDFFPEC